MLFNSGTFLKFFGAFLLLYFLVRGHLKARNVLMVAASYLFYGWWDYRFLSLLVLSSLLDYGVGLGLARMTLPTRRKLLLGVSILANLTILGFFKYYDFFAQSLTAAAASLGVSIHLQTLNVVLPVGISFYTFQSMSYAIDVYRGRIQATHELVNFLAYVAFFPQLVAGPIERAHHLLPQFEPTLTITRPMLAEGLWLCIWGLFQKVVLADNLAPLVEIVYSHPHPGGPMVLLGTVAFAGQIYCDFAGYSDIARGLARILGFDLMVNFDRPYAAGNLRDFWRRWHISFSEWLRDYLYISLGGNRLGTLRTHANLILTMLLGGLWHGAAWNFVIWGLWHGAGLSIHRAWSERTHRKSSPAWQIVGWAATLLFVLYGWLLFRAGSLQQVMALTRELGDFSWPTWTASYCINLALFSLPLVVTHVWPVTGVNGLPVLALPKSAQATLQGVLVIAIILFWGTEQTPFIYFQF